jgi:hypothetical protein
MDICTRPIGRSPPRRTGKTEKHITISSALNHAQLPEYHPISPFNLIPVTHGWVSWVDQYGLRQLGMGWFPTSIGHEEGSQVRQRRTVDGLLGYVGEHHVGMEVVLHRMGAHGRSCTGHRNDEEEVRP